MSVGSPQRGQRWGDGWLSWPTSEREPYSSAEGGGQRHWLLIRASGYPVDPLSRIPLLRNRRSFGGTPNHSYSSTAIGADALDDFSKSSYRAYAGHLRQFRAA